MALQVAQSEWVEAHEMLSRLARARAAADAEEGRWLLAALRSAAHVHLGFGSFGEYVARLFGYTARSTQEKLRVAEALEGLPLIAAALEEGALNWSAVRELTRAAVADTEFEWLEVARGKTVHQLEGLVAGKMPGDRPASPAKAAARRHVLRFEVAAETLCLFRETMQKLRRSSSAPLDDDAALLLMARQVLGGPRNDGRASYQIALSVCPACGQGRQQASGELVPVGADVVAMADCDGQHLGSMQGPGAGESVSGGSVDAGTGRCAVGERNVRNDAHTGVVSSTVRELRRAKQSIPPATRRAVLRRDHQCCTVPGCRNSQYLDVHHVRPRSEGGSNGADNLITLCGAHHRAGHRGELEITGSVSRGVRFRHADGSGYGQVAEPRAVEVQVKVFAALRRLGFREAAIRQVLLQMGENREPGRASSEGALREALAKLTAFAYSASTAGEVGPRGPRTASEGA
jgi:5-methylcytosine-specific restriction endonuclease McrA